MATADQPAATDTPSETERSYPKCINLGCGDDYRSEWHNVDVVGHVDEQHDLNERPWPWPDDTFCIALMDNVIEHLDDRVAALRELARIVRPGGRVCVRFPHWNSPGAHTNPQHTGTITHRTFDNYLVSDCFYVRDVSCTRVRFGRAVPESWALWLADHVGHIVSGVEVVAEVAPDVE